MISQDIRYVGVNDHAIDLFESQYHVPNGMAYNSYVIADEKTAVTFTLDSLEYSGGVLDTAPFAEKGVTYLPLRALGEALGCGVTWYQDFATAALTTVK